MKHFFTILVLSFISVTFFQTSTAATVDTINIYSNVMRKNIKCVVILPESYKIKTHNYPVVYLLHGHSGNYSDWISKVPQVKNYADEFDEIIVCPDGHVNSWYFDSEVDTTIKYETYISSEVPHYIDSAYKQFLIERQERFAG
jgi:S-formylglutathione hydrolase FrmB